jgi:hypothetical protein
MPDTGSYCLIGVSEASSRLGYDLGTDPHQVIKKCMWHLSRMTLMSGSFHQFINRKKNKKDNLRDWTVSLTAQNMAERYTMKGKSAGAGISPSAIIEMGLSGPDRVPAGKIVWPKEAKTATALPLSDLWEHLVKVPGFSIFGTVRAKQAGMEW